MEEEWYMIEQSVISGARRGESIKPLQISSLTDLTSLDLKRFFDLRSEEDPSVKDTLGKG